MSRWLHLWCLRGDCGGKAREKQDFILSRIKFCFSVCGELAKIDRFVRNFVLTPDGRMRVQGGEISRTLLSLNIVRNLFFGVFA